MVNNRLALDGGEPTIPEGPPHWPRTTPAIEDIVQQALADGSWGRYESQWSQKLIKSLSMDFGCEHVLLCSSGTIGVELALRGSGVKRDDEVILAGYDFPGNFRAIEAIGATPVLIDVIEGGWVIDPAMVAAAVSEKTTAIVVSHLHGQIADLTAIREALMVAAPQRNIVIVEDACQTAGGRIGKRKLGSLGNVGVLSFGGSKLLSAGRGGALITSDVDIHQRAKIFAGRGNDAFPLSELQAAVLLPQLDQLADFTTLRAVSAAKLIDITSAATALSGLSQVVSSDHEPAYYKLPWLLANPTQGGWTREEFVRVVRAEGVALDSAFRGFTRRSPRRCRVSAPLVNSQIAAQQTVLLHHPVLLESAETIQLVGEAIIKALRNAP